jgi:hypothetical protein
MIRQDLLLVFYDRLLVPQDLDLIADHHREPILIPQDLLLVRNDDTIACDDPLLILERRLCHYLFLCLGFMSGVIFPLAQSYNRDCGLAGARS